MTEPKSDREVLRIIRSGLALDAVYAKEADLVGLAIAIDDHLAATEPEVEACVQGLYVALQLADEAEGDFDYWKWAIDKEITKRRTPHSKESE